MNTTFKLGALAIDVDPANKKPTLSPSAVKAVVLDHVGYVTNGAGKRVPAKLPTVEGDVSVGKAVKMFLGWQRAEHKEAVQAFADGVQALATGLCTGKFHVDVNCAQASGRVYIVADYIGNLTSRTSDLATIQAFVDKLNATVQA